MLTKVLRRVRRKNRIRSKVSWTQERPRLSVFRSNNFISVQLIDDVTWKTLAASSDQKIKKSWTKTDMAKQVWADIAKKIQGLKIDNIVFDRGWFAYHGRVKALAESIREAWIKF